MASASGSAVADDGARAGASSSTEVPPEYGNIDTVKRVPLSVFCKRADLHLAFYVLGILIPSRSKTSTFICFRHV